MPCIAYNLLESIKILSRNSSQNRFRQYESTFSISLAHSPRTFWGSDGRRQIPLVLGLAPFPIPTPTERQFLAGPSVERRMRIRSSVPQLIVHTLRLAPFLLIFYYFQITFWRSKFKIPGTDKVFAVLRIPRNIDRVETSHLENGITTQDCSNLPHAARSVPIPTID